MMSSHEGSNSRPRSRGLNVSERLDGGSSGDNCSDSQLKQGECHFRGEGKA